MIEELPKVDKRKTKKQVKKMIQNYKNAYMRLKELEIPKITTSYSLTPPTFGGATHSSTESTVILREASLKVVEAFTATFNRLEEIDRKTIYICYIMERSHEQAFGEMGVTSMQLSRLKDEALMRFAVLLGCEVVK